MSLDNELCLDEKYVFLQTDYLPGIFLPVCCFESIIYSNTWVIVCIKRLIMSLCACEVARGKL